MSNYLAIDTSSRYLTVLAQKGDKKVLKHIPDCAMQHSVILMGEVEKAFEECGLKPGECDFFCAVTGPGSFTGIRIGIATAKGFALATGKPLKSVTSFELIAYNVNSKNYCVAIDAAHSHYYVCGFEEKGKVSLSPRYMDEASVNALGCAVFGFEDLPLANYTKIDVKNCLEAAVGSVGALSKDMQALYVRKSQAEEARNGNQTVGL